MHLVNGHKVYLCIYSFILPVAEPMSVAGDLNDRRIYLLERYVWTVNVLVF